MPLTRKALKAMGVDEEKIEQIIDLHTETTDALKAERDNYKADAEKLQSVQRELDQANETLAKHGKGEVIAKSEYEKILNEFNDYKAQVTAAETKHAKERAYREMLKANNVSEKRIDSIVKVANLEDFELDKDGNVKDAEKHHEKIKAEWSDFIVGTKTVGANTATPPATANAQTLSKSEIMKIKDTTERQQAWANFITQQKGE